MIGIGTLINTVSIAVGGVIGIVTGKLFSKEQQESLNRACGVSVLFIAIAGAMEGMLTIEKNALISGKSTLIFCVGINLVWGKKLSVANMLPAIFFAVVAAYMPIEF